MRIFLVRHGESLGNVDKSVHKTMPDFAIPLSDEGHEQAERAGNWLNQYLLRGAARMGYAGLTNIGSHAIPHYGRMYTEVQLLKPRLWQSPYKRTRETADHIASALGENLLDRREHLLFCEQHFGLFDGIPDDELPKVYPEEHAHYKKCEDYHGRFWSRMPMGESRFDVAMRVHQAFGTLQRDAEKGGVKQIVVVAHGVTLRCFMMMWLHKPYEWIEQEPNPANCSIRLIEGHEDKGYIYQGSMEPEPRTYFISGHGNVTEEEFQEHYVPQLRQVLSDSFETRFVVGDFRGADTLAQQWLLGKTKNVTVYHMFESPRFNAGWPTKGGFQSNATRDRAMTAASDDDIAWLRDPDTNSGTRRNLLRRKKA